LQKFSHLFATAIPASYAAMTLCVIDEPAFGIPASKSSSFKTYQALSNAKFFSPEMIILKEPSKFPNYVPGLPLNYNFEIQKTLNTISRLKAERINLQFPDGLLSYAPIIINTIEEYTRATCIILNDVVYGACCIDDRHVDCDLLIHYGHSCLIPVSEMSTRVLYVFVEIKIDINHLFRILIEKFSDRRIAIIGTIQYNTSVNALKRMLNEHYSGRMASCVGGDDKGSFLHRNDDSLSHSHCACSDGNISHSQSKKVVIPQVKPLSPGEVLGCTSPIIRDVDDVVYIGDGRFHLESAMIRNPFLTFYKYCPFNRRMTVEKYNYEEMKRMREGEIKRAFGGKSFGVILGTLGRQGNRQIMKNVIERIKGRGNYKIYKILLEEINGETLDSFEMIDSFVQISCPRLSIDWGAGYRKPLLNSYEVFYEGGEYAMDYYSNEGMAPWKNYNNR